jgi:hypothetical protein
VKFQIKAVVTRNLLRPHEILKKSIETGKELAQEKSLEEGGVDTRP